MSKARTICVAASLLALALAHPPHATDPSAKLDRALREWIARPTASARVLIRARAAGADRVHRRVARLATGGTRLTSPTLTAAELDARAVRALAADRDVAVIS